MKPEYIAAAGCFAFAGMDYILTDFGVLAWFLLGCYIALDRFEQDRLEQ